jgi:hypothetical protein
MDYVSLGLLLRHLGRLWRKRTLGRFVGRPYVRDARFRCLVHSATDFVYILRSLVLQLTYSHLGRDRMNMTRYGHNL